jgi:hypothetical protein
MLWEGKQVALELLSRIEDEFKTIEGGGDVSLQIVVHVLIRYVQMILSMGHGPC